MHSVPQLHMYIIMLFCTHLNIRIADYDAGMREHIPLGPESREKGQKDDRRLGFKSYWYGIAYRVFKMPQGPARIQHL